MAPKDITPYGDAIRWEVTEGSLVAACERHWDILLPELLRLQAEHDATMQGYTPAPDHVRQRRAARDLKS